MPSPPRVPRLGAAELGKRHHICGLFSGPGNAADAMVPFAIEGLAAGERVVEIVKDRSALLERLAGSIDAAAAVASGQLAILTWDEAYLQDGTFDSTRMLAFIRRSIRESRALGFPAVRIVGDMGWAGSDVPGVDQLLDYEVRLDALVRRPRVVVVCAYDTHDQRTETMPAIVAAHDGALVGDTLRPRPRTAPGARPRARILAAAAVLFAENGTSRTGVDTLIEAAAVAKATFYRHFPSKDDLIVAWLEQPGTRWFEGVRTAAEARSTTPGEVIPRLFEVVAEWLEANDFIGCPYLNTALEISDARHPASTAARAYLAEIGADLETSLRGAGQPDAAALGRRIHALLAGAISLAVATRTTRPVLDARDAAVVLLGATSSPGRRRRRGPGR